MPPPTAGLNGFGERHPSEANKSHPEPIEPNHLLEAYCVALRNPHGSRGGVAELTETTMSVQTTVDDILPVRSPDSSPTVGSRGIRAGLRDFHSRSRRLISTHRRQRKERDREISDQSRRGLDWTNFFMADVQVGFGSFLAFYLADQGWSKQNVGFALTVGTLAGVICLIPGGALTDALRWKRGLTAVGILAIAGAAFMLALRPSIPVVFGAELLHGVASGVLAPAIAAIGLGLAGRHGMSSRVGRNFRFAAAGNALTAAVMGVLAAH